MGKLGVNMYANRQSARAASKDILKQCNQITFQHP